MKTPVFILLLIGLSLETSGQESYDSLLFNKICAEANITGAAFSELDSSGVVELKTYGVRNYESKQPITTNTIFEAASLSKPVFSALVFKLAENQLINLDKPLTQYLPFNTVSDPRIKEVTARHVLSHTAGLPNWINKTENAKLKFDPGSKFSYSGEGYLYLQRVLEHLTQKSINELMTEYIFDPYDMVNSSFKFNDTLEDYAHPHDKKGNLLKKKLTGKYTSVASSLHTTIEDYSKFILKYKADTSIFQTTIQVDKKKNLFWGLGCGYELHNSDTLIWHWGNNWNTFRSVFVYSLNEQKGYVLLTNSENGHRVLQELNRSMFNKTLQFPKWLGYKQTTIANKT